jgi:hypothetical protein
VPWGRRRLVDGAVANDTSIGDAVDALGAGRIYVLPTHVDARLRMDLAHYCREVGLIALPVPDGPGPAAADFGQCGRLIREALACARAALAGHGPERLPREAPMSA